MNWPKFSQNFGKNLPKFGWNNSEQLLLKFGEIFIVAWVIRNIDVFIHFWGCYGHNINALAYIDLQIAENKWFNTIYQINLVPFKNIDTWPSCLNSANFIHRLVKRNQIFDTFLSIVIFWVIFGGKMGVATTCSTMDLSPLNQTKPKVWPT